MTLRYVCGVVSRWIFRGLLTLALIPLGMVGALWAAPAVRYLSARASQTDSAVAAIHAAIERTSVGDDCGPWTRSRSGCSP
jgi:hypothetical protein